jgi:hypothetical protein
MRRRGRSTCWLAVLAGCLALVGCERAAVRPNYPRDPLLLSKRPVEGKVENTPPLVAQGEPVMPAVPPTALASAPKGTAPPTDRVPQLDEQKPADDERVPARPAVQTKTAPSVPASPAVRRQEPTKE